MQIKLGNTPKTFKKIPVKFTFPDGEPGAINVTFKYRTRKGYGEYLNKMFAGEADKPVEGEKPDFAALFSKGGEKSVVQLMEAIDSWDLDYPLDKETLMQLQDETPAAIVAFSDAYRAACIEGRLGN